VYCTCGWCRATRNPSKFALVYGRSCTERRDNADEVLNGQTITSYTDINNDMTNWLNLPL